MVSRWSIRPLEYTFLLWQCWRKLDRKPDQKYVAPNFSILTLFFEMRGKVVTMLVRHMAIHVKRQNTCFVNLTGIGRCESSRWTLSHLLLTFNYHKQKHNSCSSQRFPQQKTFKAHKKANPSQWTDRQCMLARWLPCQPPIRTTLERQGLPAPTLPTQPNVEWLPKTLSSNLPTT